MTVYLLYATKYFLPVFQVTLENSQCKTDTVCY